MREAEGLTRDLIVLPWDEVVDLATQVTSEHTIVLLSYDDLLKATKDFLSVLGQRIDEAEVGMSDLVATFADLMRRFEWVTIGTAPSDVGRIGILIAFDL